MLTLRMVAADAVDVVDADAANVGRTVCRRRSNGIFVVLGDIFVVVGRRRPVDADVADLILWPGGQRPMPSDDDRRACRLRSLASSPLILRQTIRDVSE